MELSKRVTSIPPSATLSITSKAKALAAEGEDVVILAAGEPDFDTPWPVKEAAIKAIESGDTKYTPAGGTRSLKEAICRKLKKDNSLGYSVDEVVVSNGAKHSIYNVLQVILSPGDEVLIISPYWLSYPEMVKLADAKPKVLRAGAKKGFKVDADEVRSALTPKTRAIIINSPSNPAGVVYSEKELKAIAEVCVKAGVLIISDEIYEKIIFDGMEHFSIAAASEAARKATIVVNGVSKSYSMTGWRIGYAAGDQSIIKAVSTLQSHSTSNPCSISQAAAEYALSSGLEKDIKKHCAEFQRRRDVLMERLEASDKVKPFRPSGAFYMFCDISACGMDSLAFSQKLLEEKKVAVIPGGPFGEDGFIRISFAASVETLQEGVKRILEWVA